MNNTFEESGEFAEEGCFNFKQQVVMMKKAKEVKDTRKNNPNFFKYVNSSKPNGFSIQSKTHTRSMMDLDPNTRYQQSARETSHHNNNNKENHQLSLYNHTDQPDNEVKSNSLKKFLSLFGTNPINNPILNPTTNNNRLSMGKEEKLSARGSSRQVFTCNIKNMNVNVSNSKEKEHFQNKSTLILKKEKVDQTNGQMVSQLKAENEELKQKLKNSIQQSNLSFQTLKDRIKSLQNQISAFKKENSSLREQQKSMQQKFMLRQRSLQKTIENLQKNMVNKQKRRQHDLIIQSLKKVINQQLRKIIQLQKFKIQREEIQKLEERINKNMAINIHESKHKHQMEAKEIISLTRRDETIKINDDNSFSESALTSRNDNSQFEMIEQAEEHEEFSRDRLEEDGDSILQQVDKYLVEWRSKH